MAAVDGVNAINVSLRVKNGFDFGEIGRYPALASPGLWRNPTHLNATGAGIFSDMLNDSLRS